MISWPTTNWRCRSGLRSSSGMVCQGMCWSGTGAGAGRLARDFAGMDFGRDLDLDFVFAMKCCAARAVSGRPSTYKALESGPGRLTLRIRKRKQAPLKVIWSGKVSSHSSERVLRPTDTGRSSPRELLRSAEEAHFSCKECARNGAATFSISFGRRRSVSTQDDNKPFTNLCTRRRRPGLFGR